ncbi:carbohydrate porin, partial [Klebsiella pneumoniae]
MTMIKKLPLTMAVIAAFFPLTSVMAQEFTQEQIDAIVAKAVDKALADRQAKIDAAANKKVDVITNPETTAASPDMAIPFGLKFSGYARYGAHFQTGDQKYVGVDGSYNGASAIGARYGAHFQTGDQKYVGVDGSYNGASAIGRLGNESNGGEFQISKAFKSAQGAIWDLNVMFDHWSDEVNLKKAYVGVTNVLESNPNAYIWAGRDFHQRPQQGINDYFWMNHDGQGAGVKNFDIGGVQFDVAAVSQVKSCSPEVMADETNPSRITCTGS